jgi:Tfp pilus assembly protein PilO
MSYKLKFSILVIVFLVLDFALIFLIRNFFLEIKKVSLEINQKKSETLLLEKKAQSAEDFSNLFQSEKGKIEKIESFFINSEMPVDFLNFLEKTAKDLNLSFKFSISQPTREKDPWPTLNFQINLVGFPSEIFKFLKKLNYSSYLIQIQNLEILKAEKSEKEVLPGQVETNLLIKVYAK